MIGLDKIVQTGDGRNGDELVNGDPLAQHV